MCQEFPRRFLMCLYKQKKIRRVKSSREGFLKCIYKQRKIRCVKSSVSLLVKLWSMFGTEWDEGICISVPLAPKAMQQSWRNSAQSCFSMIRHLHLMRYNMAAISKRSNLFLFYLRRNKVEELFLFYLRRNKVEELFLFCLRRNKVEELFLFYLRRNKVEELFLFYLRRNKVEEFFFFSISDEIKLKKT